MDNIRIVIVEDELIVSEEIKEVLILQGYDVVGQCSSAAETMQLLSSQGIDIALLDINIDGEKDGIALAHDLKSRYNCAIIFLTAYADDYFFERAKAVNPAAYIVKPFEKRNLQMAVEVAFNNLLSSGGSPDSDMFKVTDAIFIKENSRYRKINIDNICYAAANGSYTDVYTDSGVSTLAINLKHFENHLESQQFMRVHRSYVVNLNKVDEYIGNRIFINTTDIPLSTSFKEAFLEKFTFL